MAPAFAPHVVGDWEVCAEETAEGLEGGVGAQWDVVPCEVWVAVAEDDG